MSLTPHSDAVERALAQGRRHLPTVDEPLAELCRTLSRQMDAAGDDPSTRLSAAYLSAIRALSRALGASVETPTTGKLAQLRGDARKFRSVGSDGAA